MVRETVMYCQKYEDLKMSAGFRYDHFSSHPKITKMYDEKMQILEVLVRECAKSKDTYWGWWSNEERKFSQVYVAEFLVEMCFPYGTKVEEKRGRGHLLPVFVDVLKTKTVK